MKLPFVYNPKEKREDVVLTMLVITFLCLIVSTGLGLALPFDALFYTLLGTYTGKTLLPQLALKEKRAKQPTTEEEDSKDA